MILKTTDGVKWHFEALKSIKQMDNTFNSSKAFARLMTNI